MTININQESELTNSYTPGYSGCGCGSRRYYTKAEIDEMFKDIIDPEKVDEILEQMFEDYIESGELYDLIVSVIGDIYTKDEINTILSNYASKNWVENKGYLTDITLTINGTEIHNNGDIVIEGGGTGGTIDISGKLDTSAFTAYSASTEEWKNNMDECCLNVNSEIDGILLKLADLQNQIDNITGYTPSPDTGDTGDTPVYTTKLMCVYNVTSTTEPTVLTNFQTNFYSAELEDETVIPVDEYTFSTTGLHTVYFTLKSAKVSVSAFENNNNLVRVVIPDDITAIVMGAFAGCTNLTGATIGAGVTVLDDWCFRNTNISYINVPDSVQTIGPEVFADCHSLTGATIGTGIKRMNNSVFPRTALEQITIKATTAPEITSLTFTNIKSGGTLFYPAGSDYSSFLSSNKYYLGYKGWTGQPITV